MDGWKGGWVDGRTVGWMDTQPDSIQVRLPYEMSQENIHT